MEDINRAGSTIHGSYSGNDGSHNVFGSNNTIRNTNVILDMTNLRAGSQGGVLGVGYGEPIKESGPYRLIPYGRNSTFTGRKNLLESVKRFSEPIAHNRIALHGLGGSGKTQIALEYVYQCTNESDRHVFWVQGSGLLKFSEGFRDVAQLAQIPVTNAKEDEEGFLKSIRRWFESPNSGDWILVIDNADNDTDFVGNNGPITKFVPQGTKGTIIFTTRSGLVASRQGCKVIEVGEMGEDDALELFSKRFTGRESLEEDEKSVLEMILGSVHHLPLAIIGAAAFMAETKTSPSTYWTIFQESDERAKRLLSQQFYDNQREVDVTESILSTYFITFDRITQQVPPAADLLRLMAFLNRQNIPEELLIRSGLKGMNDSIRFRQSIARLLAFSLVAIVMREEKTFYELHRLVQLSLQVYYPTKQLKQARAAALRVVSQLFPRDKNERREIGHVYIPHALAVTQDSRDPIAEELCFHMGLYLREKGSYNDAEILFRRCIALRGGGKDYGGGDEDQREFALPGAVIAYREKTNVVAKMFQRILGGLKNYSRSNSADTLKYRNCLAITLHQQGKFEQSETMHRHILERWEKILGPDHTNTLLSTINLANVLQQQGKYNESEAMHRRTLERGEKILGPDDPNTLGVANNLASVLRKQGKYEESEVMQRCTLERQQKILGPDHPDTLTSINNLALMLELQGKYQESEAMHRRTLARREKILGPDHPDTLASIHNLALVLQHQGKYQESETMQRCTLERKQKILGPDHPDTLASTNNLALMLQGQGKYEESERMHRHTLERRKKILRPDHPKTLTSTSNLALVLQRRGKYQESETMQRCTLERQQKILGPDHPDTLASTSNLALVLQHQGKYEESETMHRHTLERGEKVLGPDNPNTLASINNLALVLQLQGKYQESETMHRRTLARREKIIGPDHPDTLASINNLALVLQLQGKYQESETMQRCTLEKQQKILRPDHPDTLTSTNNLANAVQRQGKYEEPETMHRHPLDGYESPLDQITPTP